MAAADAQPQLQSGSLRLTSVRDRRSIRTEKQGYSNRRRTTRRLGFDSLCRMFCASEVDRASLNQLRVECDFGIQQAGDGAAGLGGIGGCVEFAAVATSEFYAGVQMN